ncbi:hypothetical protein G9A89_003824 [Geosiphon pyriformis]|nr:hypothetical protein G9A89_003824 [Geosiphon pyriformis]
MNFVQTKILIPKNSSLLPRLETAAQFASAAYCLSHEPDKLSQGVYVGFYPVENVLYIAFHHTRSRWRVLPKELIQYQNEPKARVDKELYNKYETFKQKLVNKFLNFWGAGKNINKIIFVGHYLGGVLAVFAALDFKRVQKDSQSKLVIKGLKKNRPFPHYPDIQVLTFGSPRFGDWEFSNFVNKELNQIEIQNNLIQKVWRITYQDDYIPQFPSQKGNTTYFHHTVEIWIGNNCDCKLGKEEIYECIGVRKPLGYIGEPEVDI